jgi:hypothetical protein
MNNELRKMKNSEQWKVGSGSQLQPMGHDGLLRSADPKDEVGLGA